MKAVFVVTHRSGFEADPVIDALRRDGIPVFRFNCDAGGEAPLISFAIDAEDIKTRFICDTREISGTEVGVGWCQQLPPYLGQAASIDESLQRENLWAAHLAAFDILTTPWLNKPRHVLNAANKLLQLGQAQSIGLRIPVTLISNVPPHIRAFVERQPTVAKNLATPWVVSHQETRAAYTKLVASDWLAHDAELEFCPIIYQAYHTRRRDYRVVVVGDLVFAACCEPIEGQHEDIRRGVATGESFRACEFSAQTIQLLRLLMERLSIEYCAADFMEDNEGNLYFLEVNTCGAWWWVDRLYDGMICGAIVEYLKQHL